MELRQSWFTSLAMLTWALGGSATSAAERPRLAISATDLDVLHCVAFADGVESPAPSTPVLSAVLGISPPVDLAGSVWSLGPVASEVRHFRIAFKQPIVIGTACSNASEIAILRDDAKFPGDLKTDADWQPLAKGLVRALPPGSRVRALRVSLRQYNLAWDAVRTPAVFPGLVLLQGRYFNPVEFGRRAWASVNVAVPAKESAKNSKSYGKQWQWTGFWPGVREVTGLVANRWTLGGAEVSCLGGSQLLHPQLAKPTDWQPIDFQQCGLVLTFDKPGSTHAIRVLRDPSGPAIARDTDLPELTPLVALGAKEAAPTVNAFAIGAAAPVALRYEMPFDGFVAIRLEDSQGKHVRRLVAEVERERGSVLEPWDLMDDDEKPVPPGKYKFVGLARPPLKLTYEMTVYNAGNPPWMAPVPGGGWWMADHSPPMSACSVGDVMFFGAGGAEFGVPLIATDRDGKKLWHDLHLGAERLVSDGRYAYVVNGGEIVRIDPQNNFAKLAIHKFKYTDTIPSHGPGYIAADRSGAAAFGNLLCVSYSGASQPWIRSAMKAGEIDLDRCLPRPLPKKVHETALDPREFILSTFQTIPSSTTASFGPTLQKGPLANTLILALKREVPVGSIVLPPGDVQVWALRPGRALPAEFIPPDTLADATAKPSANDDPLADDLLSEFKTRFDPQIWAPLKGVSAGQASIVVPEAGLTTKTLLFTAKNLQPLDYALVLDRRYRNATPQARFLSLEGKSTERGGWQFKRTSEEPLSYGNPAVAAYVWDKPARIRGFMLTRPLEWSGIAVDIWSGDDSTVIDQASLRDTASWRQVYLHQQTRNQIKFSWHTNRVITGDFGETISARAVRIRVVEPPNGAGYRESASVSGGFESFITFEPIGKDPELPVDLAQRVTVLDLPQGDAKTATVRHHLALAHPTALTFDRQGRLYASCDDGICRLSPGDRAAAQSRVTVVPRSELGKTRALAFDSQGLLCAIDATAPHVRVFDPTMGKLVRSFGKAGGRVGPYDPQELADPVALAIDPQDKLWIVEQNFQPKRISRWSNDGKIEKQLMGPTHYGGGGKLDPGDKTVVNHLGMKFRIDYATRTWKLESRLAQYGTRHYLPDRVTYVANRRYLIGDRPVVTPFGDSGPTSVVCEERNGVAVPVVAAGVLGDWSQFSKHIALQQYAKSVNPAETGFVWSDQNGDSVVQLAEVQFIPNTHIRQAPNIGDDLSLNFVSSDGGVRLRTTNTIPVPAYDIAQLERLPELTSTSFANSRGETLVMGHKLLDASGAKVWSYPDRYAGVQASNQTPWGFYNRPPGELSGSFELNGAFEIAGERLFCVGGNNGDYFALTHDGLLAAAIVGGPRGYGRRFFSIPDCVPGQTDLSDLRKTVEDFHGHVTRAHDGHVYAIAGKNHVTLIRVDGLERMQRFAGTIEVTRDDLLKTQKWSAEKAQLERFLDADGPKRYRVEFLRKAPVIDGDVLTDWPDLKWLTVHTANNAQGKLAQLTQARLAYDSNNLYVAATTLDSSPLANSVPEPAVLFQHGDALDFHLGLNPQAPADRTTAEAGDLRLLVTARGEDPLVMMYRYIVDPKHRPANELATRTFRSPVGETRVAEIIQLDEVHTAIARTAGGWTVELAIPWKALGAAAPTKSTMLRGDFGILESDPTGQNTVGRYYWANKRHVILGDQPAEARVLPNLWGEFEFAEPNLIESLLDP